MALESRKSHQSNMGNTLCCLRLLRKTGCCQRSDGYEAEESENEDISHGSGSSTPHDAISSRKTYAESNTGTERSLVTSERPSRESEKLDDEDTPQSSSPSAKKPPKLEFPLTPNPRGKNNESSLQSIGTDITELSLCTGDQSVELGDVVSKTTADTVDTNSPAHDLVPEFGA